MDKTRVILREILAALPFFALCLMAGSANAEIIGKAQVHQNFDSFRVRRITIQVRGTAEEPEVDIPEAAMLPLDIVLQIFGNLLESDQAAGPGQR